MRRPHAKSEIITYNYINPKEPGLFDQLSTREGRGDVIWKLTSSAKIWYPIEVTQVKIRAYGGRWSGKGPGE